MAREWNRPLISLLTDFGVRDPSAGIMRGVVLGIAPDALIVDISHEVDKFAVADGALLLWSALPYMPIGSHVAVVDPGVGTERRGVAVETARGDYLIGPDNGLLIPGATRLGGIVRAHLLENSAYRLPVVTSSFHGRDLFAPAAAHLALGVPLEALGRWLDPMDMVTLDWPEPWVGDGELATSVVYVDTFGNVKLGALAAELEEALVSSGSEVRLEVFAGHPDVPATSSREVTWANTFGGVELGEPLIMSDSYGRLCLAVNQGSAAEVLRLDTGAEVWIRAAGQARPEVAPLDAPTVSFTAGVRDAVASEGRPAEPMHEPYAPPPMAAPASRVTPPAAEPYVLPPTAAPVSPTTPSATEANAPPQTAAPASPTTPSAADWSSKPIWATRASVQPEPEPEPEPEPVPEPEPEREPEPEPEPPQREPEPVKAIAA